MSDGRDIINQAYSTLKEIADVMDLAKENFSDKNFQEYKKEFDESLAWAKKCRNKVWLRSKEGTDLAQGCLDAINELKENTDDENKAVQLSFNVKYKLESLAKIIATKASVMT